MKKIRINELARELEVKPHAILDLLPGLGVTEKKTHSSSIDEDVALQVRRQLGFDGPVEGLTSEGHDDEPFEEETSHNVETAPEQAPARIAEPEQAPGAAAPPAPHA